MASKEEKEEDPEEDEDEEEEDTRTEEEKAQDEARARESAQRKEEAFKHKKTPEPGKRKFKLIIQNVNVTNDCEKQRIDLYLRFILGDTRKTIQQNGKKKKIGKKGSKFRTEVWKKLKPHSEAISDRMFNTFWEGEYKDLGSQDLVIEVWDWDRWTPDDLVTKKSLKLVDLAGGAVQQTIEFKTTDDDNLEAAYCTMNAEFIFNEIFPFELEFNDWRGQDLKASDGGFLGGPQTSSDPYLKFSIASVPRPLKKGYRFGRYTKTDVQRNTLYPVFQNCKKPLYYSGTRADLENEMLNIKAFDHDFTSRDDVIGEAIVPMAGVMDVGFLQVQLNLEERDPEDKSEKMWKEYGMVQGFIKARKMPYYSQLGQPFVIKEGINYLAVKIEKAEQLRAADVSGTSDPFFKLEWDGSSQQTPVKMKTLNPIFNHTLYFAIKAPKITQSVLEKKGAIKISCLDWDDSNSYDTLGSATLGLDKITSSFPAAKEHEETRGRLYVGVLPLTVPGLTKSEATVSVKAWFHPEIPNEIRVSSSDVVKPKDLPKRYKDRHKLWKAEFPKRADPSRLAQYKVSGTDEENLARFLCEYIHPMALPHEDYFPIRPVTPNVLARMTRNITFASDEECLNVEDTGGKFWVSPNFFMDMKKGDADAHSVFLCNLFLGTNLDAYVCVGKFGKNGMKHAWVMTREPDGSVLFWETMKGRPYLLPERWKGMFLDDIQFDEAEDVEEEGDTGEDVGPTRVSRKKIRSEEEIKEIQAKELGMVFLDEDESYDKRRIQVDAVPDPEDPKRELPKPVVEDTDGGELEEEEDRPDMEEEGGGTVSLKQVPAVAIPYNTLEFVFNNRNIWANIQAPNPARITFDFDDETLWSPFIEGNNAEDLPKPFYTTRGTIAPPLPIDRAKHMASEIRKEMEESIKMARSDKGMDTTFDKKLAGVLEAGLLKLEHAYAKWTDVARRDFDAWKGRLIAACPPGYTFEGVPISFSYTDPKRMRKYLLQKYPYHEESEDKTRFVVAASVMPYPMTTVSVWVYWAHLIPIVLKKKKKTKTK